MSRVSGQVGIPIISGAGKEGRGMALIAKLEKGLCQDVNCENPDVVDILTGVRYIESNKGPAKICQDCLEQWMEALDDYEANRADFDLGGYPFIA